MTFEEQAAELHSLEAVALSLGLSGDPFERILCEVTATAHVAGASPEAQLAEIRSRVHEQGSKTASAVMGRAGCATVE